VHHLKTLPNKVGGLKTHLNLAQKMLLGFPTVVCVTKSENYFVNQCYIMLYFMNQCQEFFHTSMVLFIYKYLSLMAPYISHQ